MFCRNCGNKIDDKTDGVRFCPRCGIKILSLDNDTDNTEKVLNDNNKANDDEIYDALSQSIPNIREVLYGKIDVTEMLTSPGNKFTTSFLSEIIPLNKFKYGIIGNVILKQFMKLIPTRKKSSPNLKNLSNRPKLFG